MSDLKSHRRFMLKNLVSLVFIFAVAQAQVQLPAPAIWLEPLEQGLGLMLTDGSVMIFDGDLKAVENHWQSDWLLACEGQVLGINKEGHLALAGTSIVGPEVALDSRPACIKEGGVLALAPEGKALLRLTETLEPVKQVALRALPDAEIVLADLYGEGSPFILILTDPTERYAHGI